MNATDLRALLARWAGIMADTRDWLIELDLSLIHISGAAQMRICPSYSTRRARPPFG